MRRRFLSLFVLLFFALPVGISLSGCGKSNASPFCTGSIGPRVGDPVSITLTPVVGGISMGFSQTQSVTTPTGADCHQGTATLTGLKYTTKDPNSPTAIPVADVNPSTGQLCAGTWNRNTAGGVPDFTFCTGPSNGQGGVAELSVSANGANSNVVPVYVHPQITSILLGNASTDCDNDQATNCPQYINTGLLPPSNVTPYVPGTCISFGQSAQLVARFFAGSKNITFQAGHATFTAQTPGLVTFEDTTGVATANAPGTTVVTATLAQSSSTSGLISVCPPKNIVLSTANAVNGNVVVDVNTNEPLTAIVTDTNNVNITGLTLTVTSTNPVAIPASASSIAPVFPGTAAINAFCLPPTCNPSPYDNVGLLGTGKPVVSNTITSTTPGSNNTRLWIGSTDSQYIVPVDLTTGDVPSPTKLPYQPNSMIMAQNGQTIYMGSALGLMTFTTSTNSVGNAFPSLQGKLLAVSPDSATTVVTDPSRHIVTIFNTTTPATISSFNGDGTRAAFTPDGSTLYVLTADNHLLVYSTFTSWQSYDLSAGGANDVAIAVPSVGAFIGGNTAINARSYCADSTGAATIFYPQAANTTVSAAVNDRIAATNDGKHVLDVRLPSDGGTPVVNDLTFTTSTANDGAAGARTFTGTLPTGACPLAGTPPVFGTTVQNSAVLTGVNTPGVTGVFPTTDATQAFTTYLPVSGAPSTGTLLPVYSPAAGGAGSVTTVTLKDGATAPVSGVFSSDNKFFFTGTAGDNQVHLITRSTLTDGSQLNPKLPSVSTPTGSATPDLLVQYPRSVTTN